MKKILKSPVIRYLILTIMAVVIGANVFALNATHLTGNAVPMPFGYGASVVLSGSMEPTLSVGDLLIVRVQDSYAEGDIVVYQSGSMPVVHRIVDISQVEEETMVTTRGDANNADDESFPVTTIKGEVVGIVPLIGYLVLGLKSPIGTILIIAAAVLLMELSFRKERQEKEMEQEKIKAEIRQLMQELEDQKQ